MKKILKCTVISITTVCSLLLGSVFSAEEIKVFIVPTDIFYTLFKQKICNN